MRIGYLECFAGVSGDMFLGALLDAGVERRVMEEATAALKLGALLRVETVDRSGISATKVHVMEGDRLADSAPDEPNADGRGTVQWQVKTQHLHKVGAGQVHTHEHSHSHDDGHGHGEAGHSHTQEHEHGRSLTVIRGLIEAADLAGEVKALALKAFELLGASEAKIHNVPVEAIHFHEVGAVDAIVDIVAASAGIHALGVGKWFCSALNVGGGMVDCAHGRFPVPAPATADLLRGVPTYSAHVEKELVTPTGAALVRALGAEFGRQPAMRVERIGYGAGTRDPKGFPNVLRLSVGESDEVEAGLETETVVVLETAIDDLNPQVLAHVCERALEMGALDVMSTAVTMKKGRQGTLLTVLCDEAGAAGLERLLFRETSTLGVRVRRERRAVLEREHVAVRTAYGEIRVKTAGLRGEVLNAAPEFEDCRAAAAKHGVPVKLVIQAATAAYAGR
jgi:uncharacterized protein (TIGR00299 family) protein